MHKFKREIKGILGKFMSMNSWYKKGEIKENPDKIEKELELKVSNKVHQF